MSREKFFIGTNEDCDIIIKDSKISSVHCSLQITSDGTYLIEDLNSTNHTYINGSVIKRSKYTSEDSLMLADRIIKFNWLQKEIKHLNNDYSEEFSELKKMYEEHERSLKSIDWKYGKKNIFIRILISLLPITASLIFKTGYPILSAISGILITVSVLYQQKNPKVEREKREENRNFFINYRCPKCHAEFGNRDWYLIENEKCCKFCKAKFV